MQICDWRVREASETLSGVTNGNQRYVLIYIYIYIYIWYVPQLYMYAVHCKFWLGLEVETGLCTLEVSTQTNLQYLVLVRMC